jgi:hypothetical protein
MSGSILETDHLSALMRVRWPVLVEEFNEPSDIAPRAK